MFHFFTRTFFLFFLVFFLGISNSKAKVGGELIEYTLIKRISSDSMKAFFKQQHIPKVMLGAKSGVDIYEVIYNTTYSDSSLVKASGLLYVPQGETRLLPTLLYNHGTEICKDRCFTGEGEQSICLAFSTDGYIVLCPDYIGMGKGERSHLYMNAMTEAGATVDMLLSVDSLLPSLGAKRGKELFVSGYSQGGHAAMATHRLLQENYANRFSVTASSPMSGPYDMENTVYTERYKKYTYPGYLMFLLQSFYESKGMFQEMANVLKAPYSSNIPPLMNGQWSMDVIDKFMPDTAFRAIKTEFVKEFEENKNSPFRKYLAENNVFNWKPEAPVQLCYCDGDKQVNYQNSLTAYKTMKENGSKHVELWRAGKKFDHFNCALFAVIYTKMFFDGYVHGHPGSHGPQFKRMLLNMGKLAVKP